MNAFKYLLFFLFLTASSNTCAQQFFGINDDSGDLSIMLQLNNKVVVVNKTIVDKGSVIKSSDSSYILEFVKCIKKVQNKCDSMFSKKSLSKFSWFNLLKTIKLKSSFKWSSNTSFFLEFKDPNYGFWSTVIVTLNCAQTCRLIETPDGGSTVGLLDVLNEIFYLAETETKAANEFKPLVTVQSKHNSYSFNLLSRSSGAKVYVKFANTNYSPQAFNQLAIRVSKCIVDSQCDDAYMGKKLSSFLGFGFDTMAYGFIHMNDNKDIEFSGSLSPQEFISALSLSKKCEYLSSIFLGKSENVFIECQSLNGGKNIFSYPIGKISVHDMPNILHFLMFTKSAAYLLTSLKNSNSSKKYFESDNLRTTKSFNEIMF